MSYSPPSKTTARLVSVIIPTYNYGHFIGQTIESIQAQTYQNWECIIVDDGSSDNTPEVVASYAERDVRFRFIQQENQLQSVAKNNGIKNSAGEYIQFLDADDLIEPRKFERQVEYLERHPEVDIVYGSMRYFSTENMDERLYSMWGENQPWMPNLSGQGKDILKALARSNIMVINSPLVRRSVIETVGRFDERLPPAEDWDYWIRCAVEGKRFHYQDTEGTLALVRSHPSSSSRDRRRMFTSMLLIRRKLKATISDADVRRLNDEQIAEDEVSLGVEEILHGSLSKGAYLLCKAGVTSKQANHRMKLLACAFAAPFVSKQQFRKMFSSSLTGTVKGILQRSKTASS